MLLHGASTGHMHVAGLLSGATTGAVYAGAGTALSGTWAHLLHRGLSRMMDQLHDNMLSSPSSRQVRGPSLGVIHFASQKISIPVRALSIYYITTRVQVDISTAANLAF